MNDEEHDILQLVEKIKNMMTRLPWFEIHSAFVDRNDPEQTHELDFEYYCHSVNGKFRLRHDNRRDQITRTYYESAEEALNAFVAVIELHAKPAESEKGT